MSSEKSNSQNSVFGEQADFSTTGENAALKRAKAEILAGRAESLGSSAGVTSSAGSDSSLGLSCGLKSSFTSSAGSDSGFNAGPRASAIFTSSAGSDPNLITDEETRQMVDRRFRAPFGKVKLTLEFDGTAYCGWQRQSQAVPTVQGTLEEALTKQLGRQIDVMGAGRTDAGVHAINMVAHFIAPQDMRSFNFVNMFQALLPRDICVKNAEIVDAQFHAMYSAKAKTYIYKIWNNQAPSALKWSRSLWIRKPLNIDRLNKACEAIVGTHDFNCFRSEGSAIKSTIRTIHSAKFIKSDDFIEFHITGSGFLKQMVRNIVGTLLQIELHERDIESIPKLIASRDRTQAGPTVEPQGLYLAQVFYGPDLDKSAQPQ